MKGGVCREAKKTGTVERFAGEGTDGHRSSEEFSHPSSGFMVAAPYGLQPSLVLSPSFFNSASQARLVDPSRSRRFVFQEGSDVQQVPSWSASRLVSDQSSEDDHGRVPSSPAGTASGVWPFASTVTIGNLPSTDSKPSRDQQTGMSRWNGDTRKHVSQNGETSEVLGAKADSENSSFASTPPKKSKPADPKSRTNQSAKSQSKLDKSPSTDSRHSCPGSNEADESVSFEQGLNQMRTTILEQEATFREQVRELHRVYKVQTLLIAELKKKDSDIPSHSSGTNQTGPSHSPSDFTSINSSKRSSWTALGGHVSESFVQELECSVSTQDQELPKAGAEDGGEYDAGVEVKDKNEIVNGGRSSKSTPGGRKFFDLEQPPEDDDDDEDEVERKPEEKKNPVQDDCIKVLGFPVGCNVAESTIHGHGTSATWQGVHPFDSRGSVFCVQAGEENWRNLKRPRQLEEASLFPIPLQKVEAPSRESPFRPTPIVATQSFLGGLWGQGLNKKDDDTSGVELMHSADDVQVRGKKEKQAVDLHINAKSPQGVSQVPHWLLQSTVKPHTKEPEQTEILQPYLQPTQLYQQQSVPDSELTKQCSGSQDEMCAVWVGEQHSGGYLLKPRSEALVGQRLAEEGMHSGLSGLYMASTMALNSSPSGVCPCPPNMAGYGPYRISSGYPEGTRDGSGFYTAWREGEGLNSVFPRGPVYGHQLAASALPALGVQLRPFNGHPSLTGHGLVVGPAVNMGTGTSIFQEAPQGIWFQQRNPYSQFQQYPQQQQQLASVQPGTAQGMWQGPVHIPQGNSYPPGAVYAVPATAGANVGFSVDGMRRTRDDIPGSTWAKVNVGPPFSPFSIVAPPKPPFKRPPKLVLTHDGTTMELKLVPPHKEGVAKVADDRSLGASSDDEVGDLLMDKRDKVRGDVASQPPLRMDRDGSNNRVPAGRQHRVGGKRDREERNFMGNIKEKGSSSATNWSGRACPSGLAKGQLARCSSRVGSSGASLHEEICDAGDAGDAGSDGSGSGGSGVGDVINPGECLVISMTSNAAGTSLPAGEGEEGQNMGEIGLQRVESGLTIANRRLAGENSTEEDRKVSDQVHRHAKVLEQLSVSTSNHISILGKRLSREVSLGEISNTNPGDSGPEVEPSVKQLKSLEISSSDEECKTLMEDAHQGEVVGHGNRSLDDERKPHDFQKRQVSVKDQNLKLELKQPSSRDYGVFGSRGKESGGSEVSCEPLASEHGSSSTLAEYNGGRAPDSFGSPEDANNEDKQSSPGLSDVKQEDAQTQSCLGKVSSGSSCSSGELDKAEPRSTSLTTGLTTQIMKEKLEGQGEVNPETEHNPQIIQGNGEGPLRTSERYDSIFIEVDRSCSLGGLSDAHHKVLGSPAKRLKGAGNCESLCVNDCGEFAGKACDNSHLAAELLLGLAPKRTEAALVNSICEAMCTSFEQTAKEHQVGGDRHVKRQRLDSPGIPVEVEDLDIPTTKSKPVGLEDLKISNISERRDIGENESAVSEPRSPSILDFFESVTLSLKGNKPSGRISSVENLRVVKQDVSCFGMHCESSVEKFTNKVTPERSMNFGTTSSKSFSKRPVRPENFQAAESACRYIRGISFSEGSASSRSLDHSGYDPVGKLCCLQESPIDSENNEPSSSFTAKQSSSYSDGEGGISQRESAEVTAQFSTWGEVSRRKRMQRQRNPSLAQSLKGTSPTAGGS